MPTQPLRVGIISDLAKEVLLDQYTPLLNYLSRETGLRYELVIPNSYEKLMDQFREGKIDLARMGGFSFLLAQAQAGAVPLVMLDKDVLFTSYFMVKGGNPGMSLSEFKGKTIGFGSRISTSGHLMPRHFLLEKQIVPEEFFREVKYSGSHDTTALWVRDGTVDLGAANASIIDKMFKDGRLQKDDVRVLWKTPPYPDNLWAIRPDIGAGVRRKIRDTFLALSMGNEEHSKILDKLGSEYFIPVSADDFSELRDIAHALNFVESGL